MKNKPKGTNYEADAVTVAPSRRLLSNVLPNAIAQNCFESAITVERFTVGRKTYVGSYCALLKQLLIMSSFVCPRNEISNPSEIGINT